MLLSQTFSLISYHTIFPWQRRPQDTLPYLKCGTADALSDLGRLPSGPTDKAWAGVLRGCGCSGQKARQPSVQGPRQVLGAAPHFQKETNLERRNPLGRPGSCIINGQTTLCAYKQHTDLCYEGKDDNCEESI